MISNVAEKKQHTRYMRASTLSLNVLGAWHSNVAVSLLATSHYARRYYVQRKDTCPTFIPWICTCVKQILIGWKLIFRYMVQWQQIHRTAEGQRTTAFHCVMYLLPLDHVSKNQLSTNQNLLNAHTNSRNDCWICIIPLDMYRLA